MVCNVNGLEFPSPGLGSPGPPPGARPGHNCECLMAFDHRVRPGTLCQWDPSSSGLEEPKRSGHCVLGGSWRQGPWRSNPQLQKVKDFRFVRISAQPSTWRDGWPLYLIGSLSSTSGSYVWAGSVCPASLGGRTLNWIFGPFGVVTSCILVYRFMFSFLFCSL